MKTLKIENVWNSTNPNNWFVEGVIINGTPIGQTLRRRDFTGAEAKEVQFRGVTFPEFSVFQVANLEDAKFIGCELYLSDFKGANLKDAEFVRCDLRNSNFSGCNLENVKFIECDLEGADFRSADFSKCADLMLSNLSGAKLAGSKGLEIEYQETTIVYRGPRLPAPLYINSDGHAMSGDYIKQYGN